MICADFLAGASLDGINPEIRSNNELSSPDLKRLRLEQYSENPPHSAALQAVCGTAPGLPCNATASDASSVGGATANLELHHLRHRTQSGSDHEENLMMMG
jgi:hypothetical protein